METKLIAAEIATAAGVTTIITSSKDPKNIFKIIEYNTQFKSGANTPLTGRQSGRSSPEPVPIQPTLSVESTPSSESSITPTPSTDNVTRLSSQSPLVRPPHTVFVPSALPLRDLKSWTTHTLHPSGSVIIDAGAHRVLSRRESGGRLLAAGVIGVRGAFASGQAVRIVIRKNRPTDSTEADKPAGASDSETPVSAGARTTYPDGSFTTEPNTPEINPSASLSSSISSIAPMEPLDEDMTPSMNLKSLPEEDTVVIERDLGEDVGEWELEEVGRGLANYNSAQIDRVKGLRRYRTPSSSWRASGR